MRKLTDVMNKIKARYDPFFFSYMGHLDRIAHTAYLPNHEDVLYARAPTAGVIEVQFKIDNRIFR